MNLAIGAITLFLLFIVPGLIFRRFYYTAEFSKEYFKSTPFAVFLSSIIPGTVFQLTHYIFMSKVIGYDVNFEVLAILIDGPDNVRFIKVFKGLKDQVFNIMIYNVSLWVWLAFLGFSLKGTIRKLKLDRKYKLLRFKNHWHYILQGEALDFPNISGEEKKIDVTYVDAVVNVGSETVLYSGVLQDYQLTGEGSGLDYLILSYVRRRNIKDEELSDDAHYYNVPGDFFVIPYKDVINVNLSYYTLRPDEEINHQF
ncbi:hypothetical protein QQ020_24570 [Fulvivirgaceae bacterium BMA12]|uniref:Uncharacterized protein n=1 Tax=Agaribacillus aureus TaxID=3051825 RepID=A0ABT8LDW0_9BACT|nr:hypothetical protein [Fulvivirgaceae bacterium BMA12]